MTFHMQKCFSAKLQYRDYQILLVVVVVVIIVIIIIIIIIISSSSSSIFIFLNLFFDTIITN